MEENKIEESQIFDWLRDRYNIVPNTDYSMVQYSDDELQSIDKYLSILYEMYDYNISYSIDNKSFCVNKYPY